MQDTFAHAGKPRGPGSLLGSGTGDLFPVPRVCAALGGCEAMWKYLWDRETPCRSCCRLPGLCLARARQRQDFQSSSILWSEFHFSSIEFGHITARCPFKHFSQVLLRPLFCMWLLVKRACPCSGKCKAMCVRRAIWNMGRHMLLCGVLAA